MINKLVKIKYYFPQTTHKYTDSYNFVDALIKIIEKDDGLKFSGYLEKKDLKNDLLRYYGGGPISLFKLTENQKHEISGCINTTVERIYKVLPHPNPPVFVYVYPWFPHTDSQTLFHGVTAFAEYYTIHLFIDLKDFHQTSIEQTIAHEWNHLVFYRNHPEFPYTLLNHLMMEGLAEVFREESIGGETAPWSKALNDSELFEQSKLLEKHYDAKGMEVYREVFFGNKRFKKWTGYSVGYKFAKEFRLKHPEMTWEKIMKKSTKEMLTL